MRLRHWLFTLPLLALAAPATAFAEQKIGFVDLEYALNNVEEGKKAKAVLEQDYKRKKEDLEATKSTLDKMEADLKSQTLVLSEEARRQKEQDLEAARDRYDADKKAAYEAWQKKEASLTKDLLDRLTTIVQQLGKEGGYTFILERHDASVLYAEGNVDLTSEVIKRFNQSGGKP
jgi:outer membrane protein